MGNARLQSIATVLRSARKTATPVSSFGPDGSLEDAYAVQSINAAVREQAGGTRVGRKIGLTSSAVQAQLGIDEPDSGWLWSDTHFTNSARLVRTEFIAPRVEAEIAIILGADLADPEAGAAEIAAAVTAVAPAIEIVDCAIRDWAITLFDTVADNACGWGVVMGAPRPFSGEDLASVPMRMSRNGALASEGVGAATMGGPLAALGWLTRHACLLGEPLSAGEIVLTGALGPVLPAAAGDHFEAVLGPLGSVAVTFA